MMLLLPTLGAQIRLTKLCLLPVKCWRRSGRRIRRRSGGIGWRRSGTVGWKAAGSLVGECGGSIGRSSRDHDVRISENGLWSIQWRRPVLQVRANETKSFLRESGQEGQS
jgi:hypothetical protein